MSICPEPSFPDGGEDKRNPGSTLKKTWPHHKSCSRGEHYFELGIFLISETSLDQILALQTVSCACISVFMILLRKWGVPHSPQVLQNTTFFKKYFYFKLIFLFYLFN